MVLLFTGRSVGYCCLQANKHDTVVYTHISGILLFTGK